MQDLGTLSCRCKEKLPFRHKTGLERPNFLNGQRWVFLRPGPKGSFPPGSHRKVPGALKAQPGEVKASLTPHPLALYPDLRGTMPAEVLCLRACGRTASLGSCKLVSSPGAGRGQSQEPLCTSTHTVIQLKFAPEMPFCQDKANNVVIPTFMA